MEIKDILSKRRKELGLTLEDVGNIVGVGKSTVRKWETGDIENMKRDKIALLAKALKISPLVIMGWEEPPKSIQELTNNEEILLKDFSKLNDLGQHEATKRVEELTHIDKYKKYKERDLQYPEVKENNYEFNGLMVAESNDDHLTLNAAHRIEGASEEDLQHDEDIMNDQDF